jgi:hypothetical protein
MFTALAVRILVENGELSPARGSMRKPQLDASANTHAPNKCVNGGERGRFQSGGFGSLDDDADDDDDGSGSGGGRWEQFGSTSSNSSSSDDDSSQPPPPPPPLACRSNGGGLRPFPDGRRSNPNSGPFLGMHPRSPTKGNVYQRKQRRSFRSQSPTERFFSSSSSQGRESLVVARLQRARIVVIGDPGVGKTSIVQACTSVCLASGRAVATLLALTPHYLALTRNQLSRPHLDTEEYASHSDRQNDGWRADATHSAPQTKEAVGGPSSSSGAHLSAAEDAASVGDQVADNHNHRNASSLASPTSMAQLHDSLPQQEAESKREDVVVDKCPEHGRRERRRLRNGVGFQVKSVSLFGPHSTEFPYQVQVWDMGNVMRPRRKPNSFNRDNRSSDLRAAPSYNRNLAPRPTGTCESPPPTPAEPHTAPPPNSLGPATTAGSLLSTAYSDISRTTLRRPTYGGSFDDNDGETDDVGRHTAAGQADQDLNPMIADIERKKRELAQQRADEKDEETRRAVVDAYLQGASGIVLAYDISDAATLETIGHWLQRLKRLGIPPTVPVMLLCNKVDMTGGVGDDSAQRSNVFSSPSSSSPVWFGGSRSISEAAASWRGAQGKKAPSPVLTGASSVSWSSPPKSGEDRPVTSRRRSLAAFMFGLGSPIEGRQSRIGMNGPPRRRSLFQYMRRPYSTGNRETPPGTPASAAPSFLSQQQQASSSYPFEARRSALLEEYPQVRLARELARSRGLLPLELISSKTGENVDAALNRLVIAIQCRRQELQREQKEAAAKIRRRRSRSRSSSAASSVSRHGSRGSRGSSRARNSSSDIKYVENNSRGSSSRLRALSKYFPWSSRNSRHLEKKRLEKEQQSGLSGFVAVSNRVVQRALPSAPSRP